MNNVSKTVQVCFVVALIAGSLGFAAGRESRQVDVDNARETVDRAFRHWDSKTGGTVLWPGSDGENLNYNLKTFDSGKHWYVIEYDQDWGMKIIGDAEEVYPGLLDQIERMEQLTRHVEEVGPLTLAGGINGDEAQLLRNAGFQVSEKSDRSPDK